MQSNSNNSRKRKLDEANLDSPQQSTNYTTPFFSMIRVANADDLENLSGLEQLYGGRSNKKANTQPENSQTIPQITINPPLQNQIVTSTSQTQNSNTYSFTTELDMALVELGLEKVDDNKKILFSIIQNLINLLTPSNKSIFVKLLSSINSYINSYSVLNIEQAINYSSSLYNYAKVDAEKFIILIAYSYLYVNKMTDVQLSTFQINFSEVFSKNTTNYRFMKASIKTNITNMLNTAYENYQGDPDKKQEIEILRTLVKNIVSNQPNPAQSKSETISTSAKKSTKDAYKTSLRDILNAIRDHNNIGSVNLNLVKHIFGNKTKNGQGMIVLLGDRKDQRGISRSEIQDLLKYLIASYNNQKDASLWQNADFKKNVLFFIDYLLINKKKITPTLPELTTLKQTLLSNNSGVQISTSSTTPSLPITDTIRQSGGSPVFSTSTSSQGNNGTEPKLSDIYKLLNN